MTFTLTHTWAMDEKLTSAQINAIETERIKAVDGVGGGSYSGPITLTGAFAATNTVSLGSSSNLVTINGDGYIHGNLEFNHSALTPAITHNYGTGVDLVYLDSFGLKDCYMVGVSNISYLTPRNKTKFIQAMDGYGPVKQWNIINGVVQGYATSSGGNVWYIPVGHVIPNGAIVSSVACYIDPPFGHSTFPDDMPMFDLLYRTISTGVETSLSSSACYIEPIAFGETIPEWEIYHSFSGNINHTMNTDDRQYYLAFYTEGGANTAVDTGHPMKLYGFKFTYTVSEMGGGD